MAVLPAGGLFNKKEKEDKENRVANSVNQNGLDTSEPQLNSSNDSDKLKDKKGKSKVYFYSFILIDMFKMDS